MLTDLTPPLRAWIESLDGTQDLAQAVKHAVKAGMEEQAARTLLAELTAQGVLDDASIPLTILNDIPLPERDRLRPDLDALDLARDNPAGGLPTLSRRRNARVRVYGAGRLGASIVNLLAAAGVGTIRVIDPSPTRPEDLVPGGLTWSELGLPREEASVATATRLITCPHTSTHQPTQDPPAKQRRRSQQPTQPTPQDPSHDLQDATHDTRNPKPKPQASAQATRSSTREAGDSAQANRTSAPDVGGSTRDVRDSAQATRSSARQTRDSAQGMRTSTPDAHDARNARDARDAAHDARKPSRPTQAARQRTGVISQSIEDTHPGGGKRRPASPSQPGSPSRTSATPAEPAPPARPAPAPYARFVAGGPYLNDRSDLPHLVILAPVGPLDGILVTELTALNIPHMLVSGFEGYGTVGPLVHPSQSACLHCLDLTRRDRDPGWPMVTAHLGGYPAGEIACDTTLAALVAAEASRHALAYLDGHPSIVTNGTIDILPDWQRKRRTWAIHPQCRCIRNNPDSLRMVRAATRD
ncbi:ThiF family adenylyltransferase [Nonomuraea sp. NPDC059007]|uniref:ThiF family adenylyltransferase n=1 Tax=Nonomuraea sp. NPDC059007 TaxID=3346692 RepID=UPI0036BDCB72